MRSHTAVECRVITNLSRFCRQFSSSDYIRLPEHACTALPLVKGPDYRANKMRSDKLTGKIRSPLSSDPSWVAYLTDDHSNAVLMIRCLRLLKLTRSDTLPYFATSACSQVPHDATATVNAFRRLWKHPRYLRPHLPQRAHADSNAARET
jgi:hypothetical protein